MVLRATQAGAYIEYTPASGAVRATQAGAYVEYEGHHIYITQGGAYVEYTPAEAGAFDASLVGFLRIQAGRQTSGLGSEVAPTFAIPAIGTYSDGNIEQIAEWDTGAWTPTIIVERVASYAEFTLDGVLFYELFPILLEAGFDAFTPSGVGPYIYDGSASPAAVGAPTPYTFRFGGNDANLMPNSMIQVQDAYCKAITLSFDMGSKVVRANSQWFGSFVDDNSGMGYEPEAVALPDNLAMMRGLLSTLETQAAGSTGNDFTTMTAFDCSLLAWTLTIDTGLRPAWSSDQNQLTYCGIRHERPSILYQPTIRTNALNYAITKVRANLKAFDEIMLTFAGDDSRQAILKLTGRFLPDFVGHMRANDEVVMMPTFAVETPATQTTTPHWFGYEVDTQWSRP